MRSKAGPQIGFLSPAVGASAPAQGGACGEESGAARRGLDPGGPWPGPVAGSPPPRSTADSAPTCGPPGPALPPARGTSGFFGIQPIRLPRSCGPGSAGPMDGPEAPGPRQDAACGDGVRGTWTEGRPAPQEVGGTSRSLGSGPRAPSAPASAQEAFTSSFSFIQLSLGSAGERGEAEGCPPPREAEDADAKATSWDRPREDPGHFSRKDSAQTTAGSPRLECEPPCGWDRAAAASCCPDPSGLEGAAGPWDPLLRRLEPLLLECLLSNRRRLEVNSLRLKLQKLQEKAVEDEDYDKAETLKQRLEDLEREESSLHFQLPSRQRALSSLLAHLGAQAEAALCRAAQQAGSEDPQAPVGMEPTAEDSLHVAITRRDWLLAEKQQLQKEIEALQARMSVLAAKDQQLRREIEGQQQLLQWRDCGLGPLVGRLGPGELREVREAAQDTLALATQIPLPAGPPDALRSLQERIKPLELSLKEITAKVCRTERLCGTLRRKVNEIEARLPALLEAKMLAVSGKHFGTAKELAEEISSLTLEREGLEGLLDRLAVLSSRNVTALGSVREDYSRLRRELDHGKAAHEASVKEKAVRYMDALEGRLHSCTCPLLGKVWEADLEACQLLIQSLQLPEARGGLSAEEEKQLDDLGGAGCTAPGIRPGPHAGAGDARRTPLWALEEPTAPPAPWPHCAGGEQKEESCILSAELGAKCEAIGKKLLHLEDQLHLAIHSHDEDLIQSLRRELQMVKETLQAMILQLQPAREAGEREAASCVAAGVQEAQA